ncbi:MAG: DNA gyrase inhibitor YacG [Nitrospirota bacterium]
MKEPPRCPICRLQPADAAYAPFCSARCRDVDMGRWLSGTYRVPTDESAAESPTPESGNGHEPE